MLTNRYLMGTRPKAARYFKSSVPFFDKKPMWCPWACLVAQMLKNLPAMWETWVWFLGCEDSPGGGDGNALQYSCLENPMDRGAWQAERSMGWVYDSLGSQSVGYDWATKHTHNDHMEFRAYGLLVPLVIFLKLSVSCSFRIWGLNKYLSA